MMFGHNSAKVVSWCLVLTLFATASEEQLAFASNDTEMDSAETMQIVPQWDLESHFPFESPYDEKIEIQLKSLAKVAEEFAKKYKGNVRNSLLDSLREYESLKQGVNSPLDYLYLAWSVKTDDEKLMNRKSYLETFAGEQILAKHLTFYAIEVSKLSDDEVISQMENNPELSKYGSYIKKLRKKKPHFLSEEVEQALNIRDSWSACNVVTEAYEKQLSACKYRMESLNKEVNNAALTEFMFSTDQDLRVEASRASNEAMQTSKVNAFAALALNSVAGEWHIESQERKYLGLRSRRNQSNNIPDEVVEALIQAVRTEGVELTKRYLNLKKKLLKKLTGIQTFYFIDRLAPLEFSSDNKKISWEQAKEIVYDSFSSVSPTFATLFKRLLDEQRIHASVEDNKRTGAFCHGTAPQTGPFVLLSYTDSHRSVLTLGHEAGHAIHDLLAYPQGYIQYHPGLTLAETASLTGEMAVFRRLLYLSSNDEEKLSLIMKKLDDITSSVTRQISFDRFEELVHTARKNGVIGDSEFDGFWIQAMKEFYGEEGEIFDDLSHLEKNWAHVHHFIKSPFYVYAYAFADLVVGAMTSVRDKSASDYEVKLLNLLSSGGTLDIGEALKPFGLDPENPSFWSDALKNSYGKMIEEAEGIATKMGILDTNES